MLRHILSALGIFSLFGASTSLALAQRVSSPLLRPGNPFVYTCPMHGDVISRSSGTCRKCGMSLVKAPASASMRQYRVQLRTMPEHPEPGGPVTLSFRIFEPGTDRLIDDLSVVHEKPFHLFVISGDLSEFQHIHPTRQPDGSFVVKTVLPQAGRYDVFCDFSPVGWWPQVVRTALTIDGSPPLRSRQVTSPGGNSLSRTVDGTVVRLSFDLPRPVAATPVQLSLQLADAQSGAPVRDLQPFLGAWAHAVVLSYDSKEFVHLHPTGAQPTRGLDGSPVSGGGPKVSFTAMFPRPGRYRIWPQFQRGGKVLTAPFDIEVLRNDPIAVWNSAHWSAVGPSAPEEPVQALGVVGGNLYAAVDTSEGVTPRSRVMKWDGQKWSALGESFNGHVWAIAGTDERLYTAGEFTRIGDVPANGIAQLTNGVWTDLGGGVQGCKDVGCTPGVYALALVGTDVYAGGRFTDAGGVRSNSIARWDGHHWSALDGGVEVGNYDGIVRVLAVRDGSVYAGGSFRTAGGTVVNSVAEWDGNSWHSLSGGVTGGLGRVLALGVSADGRLFVGGDFTNAGSTRTLNAAFWDRGSWHTLDLYPRGTVSSIAVSDDAVYLGGATFALSSGEQVAGIVKWNGSWSRVGGGLTSARSSPIVHALAVRGRTLFAAGDAFVLSNLTADEAN